MANDQVNRDAASKVPTSEISDGGSGSTFCSPPVIHAIHFAKGVTSEYTRTDTTPIRNTDEEVSIRLMEYGNGTKGLFGVVYKQVPRPDGMGIEKRAVINDLIRRDQALRYVASALGLSKNEIKKSLDDCLAAEEYYVDELGRAAPLVHQPVQ